MIRRWVVIWSRLSLARQFALTSLVVLIAGMLVIGGWVSDKIQSGVINNTASGAALYLNSFVAPELLELRKTNTLSAEAISSLDQIYRDTPLHERVESFKIWSLDGRVLYSTNPSTIGQQFPIKDYKAPAWRGTVTASLSDLDHEEHSPERQLGIPLIEIYSPIYNRWGTQMLAVAEFYDNASDLMFQLNVARTEGWLVVAGVTGTMFLLLYGIVGRGSRTITRQQSELQQRVQQLSALLQQNGDLHQRVRNATRRAVELNERFLHRLGSELHDGPAQALGYGLLRLDAIAANACDCGKKNATSDNREVETLRRALNEALQEIRNLSTGLAIPELAELDLPNALKHAVRSHRQRTGTSVEVDIGALPHEAPLPTKIGLYRLVQEALNNAARHANGQQQRVRAWQNDALLEIEVSDAGPGFDVGAVTTGCPQRLGLSGMRERIESLGGRFFLDSAPGHGTRITAQLPLDTEAATYG